MNRRSFSKYVTRLRRAGDGTLVLEELPSTEKVLTCDGIGDVQRRGGIRILFETDGGAPRAFMNAGTLTLVFVSLLYIITFAYVYYYLGWSWEHIPLMAVVGMLLLMPYIFIGFYLSNVVLQKTLFVKA